MAHLIFLLIALALLVGFFLLTRYEMLHGVRFFADERSRFDDSVKRVEFISAHINLSAFARDEVSHVINRIGHAVAHLSLQAVRATERFLTRLVRSLRMRHAEETVPRESAREFVKTLADFKDGLKATHPDVTVPEEESK